MLSWPMILCTALLLASALTLANGAKIEYVRLGAEEAGIKPRYFKPRDFARGNWKNGRVGPAETAFIEKVAKIQQMFKIVPWYDMYESGFLWDHMMPLFHVLPGKLALPKTELWPEQSVQGMGLQQAMAIPRRGFTSSDIEESSTPAFHNHLNSGRRNLIISVSNGALWGLRDEIDQFVQLSHGVDEDHLWRMEWNKADLSALNPTLLFSKYLREHCHRNASAMAARLRKDVPTVLYIASKPMMCHQPCFLSQPPFKFCPKDGDNEMPSWVIWKGLQRLCREMNVIIRPHPRDFDGAEFGMQTWRQTFPDCIINDYKDGFSFFGLASIADVVIAEPSGISTAVIAGMPAIPAVYLLRSRQMYTCMEHLVINSSMAEIFFPLEGEDDRALLKAVRRAKAKHNMRRSGPRRAYFKKYFGYIDGYEEYRVALRILKKHVHGPQL
eukprot:TRINITY_DN26678_c0_g1_i8.p1 TRINITY_DN26678_c0_g1~~TRINITY_DN26678_c0_g1_i8.p1  ORF type:complete len:441 (-),score=70.42 TRINITY_DN26678_c0_g1_i8:67-1389(-)